MESKLKAGYCLLTVLLLAYRACCISNSAAQELQEKM
jgi:hypothetical protein